MPLELIEERLEGRLEGRREHQAHVAKPFGAGAKTATSVALSVSVRPLRSV